MLQPDPCYQSRLRRKWHDGAGLQRVPIHGRVFQGRCAALAIPGPRPRAASWKSGRCVPEGVGLKACALAACCRTCASHNSGASKVAVYDPRMPHTFMLQNGAKASPKEPVIAVFAHNLKGKCEELEGSLKELEFPCCQPKRLPRLPAGLAEPKALVKMSSKVFKDEFPIPPPAAKRQRFCPNCSCEGCLKVRAAKESA